MSFLHMLNFTQVASTAGSKILFEKHFEKDAGRRKNPLLHLDSLLPVTIQLTLER